MVIFIISISYFISIVNILKYIWVMKMKVEFKDDYIKIGLKISYYRKLKSLTQENLAEILGCGVSFIGQIEAPNIYKAISLDTLFKIAKALEIPAYKLLYFDE